MQETERKQNWAGLCEDDNLQEQPATEDVGVSEHRFGLSKEAWLELSNAKPCEPEKKVMPMKAYMSRLVDTMKDDDTPLLDD